MAGSGSGARVPRARGGRRTGARRHPGGPVLNHLLFGFALCASLAVYPGGLTTFFAALCPEGLRLARSRRDSWTRPQGAGRLLFAWGLAAIALSALPFPDNPLAPVSVSWASGSELGGLGLTLAGLWALLLLDGERDHLPPGPSWLIVAWSLAVLLLGLALGAGSWSAILSAQGRGAEVIRVVLGTSLLLLLPALAGAPGSGLRPRSFSWAVGAGTAVLLVLPQLRSSPFPLALGAWWLLLLAAPLWSRALGGALSRLHRPGSPTAAATLNGP